MPETLMNTDFRTQTRAWLEANCPPEMRTPMASEDDICWGGRNAKFSSEAQRLWLERMGERGWTAPTWPREYGGGGLSGAQAKVLGNNMRRSGQSSPMAAACAQDKPKLCNVACAALCLSSTPKCAC